MNAHCAGELQLLKKNEPDAKLKLTSLSEVYFPLVRGSETKEQQKALGGSLRIRPSRRQVVLANRALQFQSPEGSLLPISLDENKGQARIRKRGMPVRATLAAQSSSLRVPFSTPPALSTPPF